MQAHVLRLRFAQPREHKALGELAIRSKAYWGYDARFMAACVDELCVTQMQLASDAVLVAERDGEVAGFAALERLEGGRFELTHLFVDPPHMRCGVGEALLAAARERVARAGATTLAVQADPNAAPFYLRMGGLASGASASGSIPGRVLPCFEFRCESSARESEART